ncbi:MAG: metal-dependent hydrolase [Candidatus Competibacteraceae bacterium]|nr:metal-dependent hydrolase [Candidatus Competibacteraceae bacterium]
MTFGTHIAFSSVLYLGGATLFGYKPDLASWLIAAVASLLPDIDLPPSKIGRLFWFISVPLERRFGHRTLTHSFIVILAVAALSWPLSLIRPLYWGCVVGGYWSHLWIDMLNIRGVDLFWPSPMRLVAPGNRNWRIAVGSKAEMVLLSVLLVLTLALYPLSHLGFRDALQALLKSFDIAVEQYQRQIGTHWYDLELVASDNLTLARVECRCPVVGLWKGGLVVLQDGKPRAVGKSQQNHNLLPLTARLIEGKPLRVTSERVEMKGRTLRWLLGKIDQRRVYFINGEVQTGRIEPVANIELYQPVTYSGQTMTIRYARAQELGPWLDLVAAKGEVFVQFWLKPGEQPVYFDLGNDPPADPIPEELRRFL